MERVSGEVMNRVLVGVVDDESGGAMDRITRRDRI